MTSKLSNLFKSRPAHTTSIQGIIILLCLVAIIAVSSAYHPISNYDIWRNLAVGRWILEERSIPHFEFFSFTESGRQWIDYEWLSETIYWSVYSLGEVPALVLYKTILIFMAFMFLYLHSTTRGIRPLWTVPLVLVPVAALMQFRLLIRPHLHSFVLGAALLWWLSYSRRKKRLIGIFVIFMIWSTLHGGQLGLLILVISLACKNMRRQAFLMILVALAGLFMNPYTWKVLYPLFAILHIQHPTRLLVAEWSSMQPADMPWLWVYFGISVCLLAVSGRKMRAFDATVLSVFMILSIRSVRMVSYLLLLSSPGNIEALYRLMNSEKLRFTRIPVVVIACLVTGIFFQENLPFRTGIEPSTIPKAAAEYVLNRDLEIRAFNDMHQGSYLAWRWYPDNRIYMDGRTELFSDLARTERAACEDAGSWKYFLEGYEINAAVLDYPKLWQGAPTATMYPLFRFFGWQTVTWDDGGILMLSPDHGFDDLIAADRYTILDPFILDPKPYMFTKIEREIFLRELARSLRNNSESIRALYIAGNYHVNANLPATALSYYENIRHLAPEDPDINAREAMAWEKLGDYERSRDAWIKQRSHGSESGLVDYHIGRLSLLLGDVDKARTFLKTATDYSDSPPQWRELHRRTMTQNAVSDVQREIATVTTHADQIAREGLKAMNNNQWDSADSLLQMAASLAPMRPLIHQNLGVINASYRFWEQAELEFREAVAQDESSLWARYNLAGLLVEAKSDTEEAIFQLRTVLDSNPDSSIQRLAETYLNTLKKGS